LQDDDVVAMVREAERVLEEEARRRCWRCQALLDDDGNCPRCEFYDAWR
jgi:uncharacterized paraquat-inducible protein A